MNPPGIGDSTSSFSPNEKLAIMKNYNFQAYIPEVFLNISLTVLMSSCLKTAISALTLRSKNVKSCSSPSSAALDE